MLLYCVLQLSGRINTSRMNLNVLEIVFCPNDTRRKWIVTDMEVFMVN